MFDNIRHIFYKEVKVAATNGLIFGVVAALFAQIRFHDTLVSVSMALAMFVSILFAGILGTMVPFVIKKIGYDPAVASSVIILTLIDIIGFFSFLWFASKIILNG